MEIDLSQFRETFFQEAAEPLETMESSLLTLRTGQANGETLNAIFRSAHSVKAGAATFGFEATTRFTHVLESLLDRLRNGEIDASVPLVELLLRAGDVLRLLVDAAARESEPPTVWEEVIEELDRARGASAPDRNARKPAAADPHQESEYAIKFEPGPDLLRLGLDPFLVLRDLA